MGELKFMHGMFVLVLTFTLVALAPGPGSGSGKPRDAYVLTGLPYNPVIRVLKYHFPEFNWISYNFKSQRSRDGSTRDEVPNEPVQPKSITIEDRVGKVSYYKDQPGLVRWLEMRRALGPGAEFIFDDEGYIIGITVKNSGIQYETNASNYRMSGLRSDNDQCCTTEEIFFANSSLTNIAGQQRSIRQNINGFQVIRHGFCGVKGFCRGSCVQTFVNMCLYINSRPERCEFFSIPGYCTCKNFG